MIKIRAFRSLDDQESSHAFAVGQENVLKSYGITKVTSSNFDWIYNPEVYVITVEVDGKVLGGARIHGSAGTQPLPIEAALIDMDSRIKEYCGDPKKERTGELCGLWNAREISGQGLSVILTKACVAKVGVAIANVLEFSRLFVLCAPYTVKMVQEVGFEIIKDLGNNGTFPYPKDDMLATALQISDISTLKKAKESKRKEIFDLRMRPRQIVNEQGTKVELEIMYDLYIPYLDEKM